MEEFGHDNVDEFAQAIQEWKSRARFFTQVQSFVDRVDQITWDTPFVSLLSVCRHHKDLIAMMRESSDKVCEPHRTQFEKALLESERDKIRAHESTPYSAEHLNATFERLVRWSHTIRHVTY